MRIRRNVIRALSSGSACARYLQSTLSKHSRVLAERASGNQSRYFVGFRRSLLGALMSDSYPKLSVVVPVRNEERYIARTLEFLLNQDYPKDKVEILVGIAESRDRTVEVVGEIAQRMVESDRSRIPSLYHPERARWAPGWPPGKSSSMWMVMSGSTTIRYSKTPCDCSRITRCRS